MPRVPAALPAGLLCTVYAVGASYTRVLFLLSGAPCVGRRYWVTRLVVESTDAGDVFHNTTVDKASILHAQGLTHTSSGERRVLLVNKQNAPTTVRPYLPNVAYALSAVALTHSTMGCKVGCARAWGGWLTARPTLGRRYRVYRAILHCITLLRLSCRQTTNVGRTGGRGDGEGG
jgi:hypothetical protein